MQNLSEELTLVLVKPDALDDGIRLGQIISYFEAAGLELALNVAPAMMEIPDRMKIAEHYQDDEQWLQTVGQRLIESRNKIGLRDIFQGDTHCAGQHLRQLLMDEYSDRKFFKMVFKGANAVRRGQEVAGNTDPEKARTENPRSIRAKLSDDSRDDATREDRPIRNIVHVSSSNDEAKRELLLWFPPAEHLY